jgi:uncharacterized protein (TIGR02145 family)
MNKTILFVLAVMAVVYYSCRKNDEVIILNPDAGTSFLDVENDGYYVTLAAEPGDEGQTGTWRIYMGENGRFEDEHDPHSKFYGEPGETYLLGWELSEGDQYKAASINVSFKPLKPVVLTQVEDTLHNNISLWLMAEPAKFGAKGTWEIVEGEGGRIENADTCKTAFIGAENADYTVKWVLTYGSKEASVEFGFHTDTLRAFAGENDLDITTFTPIEDTKYFNLAAKLPAGAVGEWNIIAGEGGKVYVTDDPYSAFEGRADTSYYLTWKVTIDQFESIDTLRLRFRGKWGIWVDKRDNQEYRYVRIGNKEWFAENFNYAAPWTAYGRNFYYGQSARANVVDGHPVETEEDKKFYGRLYNYFAAIENVPDGWRLPSRKDFYDTHTELGGELYFYDKVIVGGETGFDINFSGFGFYSYTSIDLRDNFSALDQHGFYVTNYLNTMDWSTVFVIYYGNGGFGGATLSSFRSLGSVRYVRDVK